MSYDIELGQGDTDSVGVVLKENGVGANLTGAAVILSMKNITGDEVEITCTDNATINGATVLKSAGGMTIPFTATDTDIPGFYYGKFLVTISDEQTTFPSGAEYISVRIREGI